MHQLLLAIACLSTFVAAQNVLAIAPAPTTLSETAISAAGETSPSFAPSESSFAALPPAPGTVGLFVAGLAGLTVAGGRRRAGGRASA